MTYNGYTFGLNLFGGVGGWEVYDEALSLRTDGQELDDAAIQTARSFGLYFCKQDVTQFQLFRGHIYRILKASPPCGPFTVAGKGAGRTAMAEILFRLDALRAYDTFITGGSLDPESALVLEPARIIRQALHYGNPFRTIVMEQTREVRPIWDGYADWLRSRGYSVAVGILRAEQYGAPQTRTRTILIASLDIDVRLPVPTHSRYHTQDPKRLDPGLMPWVSMAKALKVAIPAPGAHLRSNYGTGGVAANRGLRMLNQPAPTITRKYNRNKWMVGAEVLRPMSEREASALQTFPADYPWHGRADERQLQVGNAVPPILAWHILRAGLGLPSSSPPTLDN